MYPEPPDTHTYQTPTAVERLQNLLKSPTPQLIRIGVKNKGCAGLSYHLEYVDKPGKFDEVVEQDGVKVLIDSKALFSIIGSEMDWKEDGLRYACCVQAACVICAHANDRVGCVAPSLRSRTRTSRTHAGVESPSPSDKELRLVSMQRWTCIPTHTPLPSLMFIVPQCIAMLRVIRAPNDILFCPVMLLPNDLSSICSKSISSSTGSLVHTVGREYVSRGVVD